MAVLTIRSLAPAAVLAASVGAQILSCADVECPIVPGTTFAKCTVVDKSFNAVGVARIDTDIDEFNGLSWVKAVGAEDVNSTTREFYQSFYLGTPAESSNLDGAGSACAVFFTQVSDRVRFGDGDPRGTEGTCRQALGESCVSALVDRAKAVDLDGLSGQAACDKLQREFSDNLDAACADSATGRRWTGIRAQALSGEGAPRPIRGQQNATSTCWPIQPKGHDLRLVEAVTRHEDYNVTAVIENFFSITPILTVFFPSDGNSSVVAEPAAQLTCLKTVDLTTASNETMSDEDKNENGARGRLLDSNGFAPWAGLVSIAFAALLV